MNIKYPSWNTKHYDEKDVTDAMIESWRVETEQVNAQNRQMVNELIVKFSKMLTLAKEIFGEKSAEVRYLGNKKPLHFDYDPMSVIERVEKYRKAETTRLAAIALNHKQIELTAEAIVYLTSHGKVNGIDYQTGNAIESANEMSAAIEIDRRIKCGGYHSFNGQNCDEPCEGWNGKDRRCDCGNRRVSWSWDYGHSFKSPSVCGEAY